MSDSIAGLFLFLFCAFNHSSLSLSLSIHLTINLSIFTVAPHVQRDVSAVRAVQHHHYSRAGQAVSMDLRVDQRRRLRRLQVRSPSSEDSSAPYLTRLGGLSGGARWKKRVRARPLSPSCFHPLGQIGFSHATAHFRWKRWPTPTTARCARNLPFLPASSPPSFSLICYRAILVRAALAFRDLGVFGIKAPRFIPEVPSKYLAQDENGPARQEQEVGTQLWTLLLLRFLCECKICVECLSFSRVPGGSYFPSVKILKHTDHS